MASCFRSGVKRTAGFTTKVWEYDRVRDRAYVEMAWRADLSLANGSQFVVIDAVHGKRVVSAAWGRDVSRGYLPVGNTTAISMRLHASIGDAVSRGRGRPPRRVRLNGQALRRRAQNPPRNEPTHDALNEAIVEPEAQRELSSADRPA